MPSSASDTDSHDLFPVMRRHRRERAAQVFVDNVSLGLVLRSSHITPAMRAHAITIKELEPVLAGKDPRAHVPMQRSGKDSRGGGHTAALQDSRSLASATRLWWCCTCCTNLSLHTMSPATSGETSGRTVHRALTRAPTPNGEPQVDCQSRLASVRLAPHQGEEAGQVSNRRLPGISQ